MWNLWQIVSCISNPSNLLKIHYLSDEAKMTTKRVVRNTLKIWLYWSIRICIVVTGPLF